MCRGMDYSRCVPCHGLELPLLEVVSDACEYFYLLDVSLHELNTETDNVTVMWLGDDGRWQTLSAQLTLTATCTQGAKRETVFQRQHVIPARAATRARQHLLAAGIMTAPSVEGRDTSSLLLVVRALLDTGEFHQFVRTGGRTAEMEDLVAAFQEVASIKRKRRAE